MLKKIIILLLPILIFGHTDIIKLEKLPYDKLKSLFFEYESQPKQQKLYAQAFLNKALKESNRRQIARGYYWFSLMNKNQKAITFLDSVIKYSTNTDDPNFPIAAYCEKASILSKTAKHEEAMKNLLLAEKYAIDNNRTDDYYAVLYYIAFTKSNELGEFKEALDKYRTCYAYLKSKDLKSSKYEVFHLKILFALADVHNMLHHSDSATYYNKIGLNASKIAKNKDFNAFFILNEGANLVNIKKYNMAIDSIQKIIPYLIKSNELDNTMVGYFYLGKAYSGLKQDDKAVRYFIKVDSIYQFTKNMYPELTSTYQYLIDYYKKNGKQDKQLEYIDKYMKIDDSLQKSHNKMYKLLVKEYDIPHLMKDKESLIDSLQKNKRLYYWIIGTGILFSIVLVAYTLRQRRLKKKYKTRFDRLIRRKYSDEKKIVLNPILENIDLKSKELNISVEKINELLVKLSLFENNKDYLKPNISLQSMADELNTNTKYLSTIVNIHKKKKFVDYINDLRIDHAVIVLQEDLTMRKYTIEALALEFGFNNSESFSNAFYKKTGIKPSFFIKELDF